MNDGSDYPSEFLKYLYYSIKQKPLGWNKYGNTGIIGRRLV